MDMSYSLRQLTEPVENLLIGNPLLGFDLLLQVSIFSILCDDAQVLLVDKTFVVFYDVWVVKGL